MEVRWMAGLASGREAACRVPAAVTIQGGAQEFTFHGPREPFLRAVRTIGVG